MTIGSDELEREGECNANRGPFLLVPRIPHTHTHIHNTPCLAPCTVLAAPPHMRVCSALTVPVTVKRVRSEIEVEDGRNGDVTCGSRE